MTTDCLLNYQFSTWTFEAQNTLRTCFVHKVFFVLTFRAICVHNKIWQCSVLSLEFSCKGKYLSEALIFASTNPQYDDRFLIELQVQYMRIPSSEHSQKMFCTQIVFLFLFWHSEQFVYTHNRFWQCSELGIFMCWTDNSMDNLFSYCGLVDSRISMYF